MTKTLELREVFTPGGIPSITYVGREHLELERKIEHAVVRGFAINVVTGPTKSGKSVLCHRVLGKGKLITIEGGQVGSEEEFWSQIAHKLNIVSEKTKMVTRGETKKVDVSAGWTLGAKILTQTSAETNDAGSTSSKYTRVDKLDCITALMDNKACLLVDDFHYIEKLVQKAIIQGIKGPVMQGLTVFLLAVPHRAFDPMTVENEVEGRFKHIEIPNWEIVDLLQIPQAGFDALKISTTGKLHQRICQEAFGNPLLVQEACSEFCLANNILCSGDSSVKVDEALLDVAFAEISKSKGFPKFQKLKKGPQARKMRQSRVMKDGGAEDIYSAIMMAVARTGPKPVTTYDEIRASLKEILGEGSFPQKNEITSALNHMSRIAKEKIIGEPPLEWVRNDDELVITDPFLLFYMKYAFVGGNRVGLAE